MYQHGDTSYAKTTNGKTKNQSISQKAQNAFQRADTDMQKLIRAANTLKQQQNGPPTKMPKTLTHSPPSFDGKRVFQSFGDLFVTKVKRNPHLTDSDDYYHFHSLKRWTSYTWL